jgi:hypothetical protein
MIILFEEITMNDLMVYSGKHTLAIVTVLSETHREALITILRAYDLHVAALYMAPPIDPNNPTKTTPKGLIDNLRKQALNDGWGK